MNCTKNIYDLKLINESQLKLKHSNESGQLSKLDYPSVFQYFSLKLFTLAGYNLL